jgi:hypothetical protein
MAPVIRISDEVFRKLQLVSEPLVDTPNSVIERLLDAALTTSAEHSPRAGAVRETRMVPEEKITQRGVFLAPANEENINTTLAHDVLLAAVQRRLDAQSFSELRSAVGDKTSFRCWAMTAGSRGKFDNMRVGDLVLFTPKGTGRFTYRARVSAKLESQPLGDILWPITPNLPWSLIYLLEDVREVNLSKESLVAEFGYDRGFPVYGIIRVAPERVTAAAERRGDLEKVLSAAAIKSSR